MVLLQMSETNIAEGDQALQRCYKRSKENLPFVLKAVELLTRLLWGMRRPSGAFESGGHHELCQNADARLTYLPL